MDVQAQIKIALEIKPPAACLVDFGTQGAFEFVIKLVRIGHYRAAHCARYDSHYCRYPAGKLPRVP